LLTAGLHSLSGATLYWDATGAAAGVGGSGAWGDGSGNWSIDADGIVTARWANTNRDTADFRGHASPYRVKVSDSVSAGALLFHSGGYTLSGATLVLGRISGTGHATLLNYMTGEGDNTISANIVVHDAGTIGSTANYIINNSGTGALTLAGDLSFDFGGRMPAGNKSLVFQTGTANASIVLNGNIARGAPRDTTARLALVFGQGGTTRANAEAANGTFFVNGDNTCGRGAAIHGGVVIVGHNNAFGSATVSLGNSGSRGDVKLLTDGARSLANAITISGAASSQVYVGGGTAHESTFRGDFNLTGFGILGTDGNPGTISNPDPILIAVAGGKVNFDGALSTSVAIPRGVIKQGAGIVSLNNKSGNNLKGVTMINEGTLLLMNTSGSATGDASQLSSGKVAVVVEADARLGGSGSTSGLVGAKASTSVITPGDMTKDGVSAVGTLNLTGGLVANSGATFALDVNGAAIDCIHLGSAVLDLDGVVTVHFTRLGAVQTGTAYRIVTGSGDWSSSSATFVFNSPTGYVLDTTYGDGNGYLFDRTAGSLTVQFAPLPEPSTYASSADAGGT
jgi:fibronectin-binding autotransporter adhesin